MAPITLQCTSTGCTAGEAGGRYKTPLLEPELVIKCYAVTELMNTLLWLLVDRLSRLARIKQKKFPAQLLELGSDKTSFLLATSGQTIAQ